MKKRSKVIKDENDVEALQKIIKEQNAMGAKMPEDIDDEVFYGWAENGRLSRMWVSECGLSGALDISSFSALYGLNVSGNVLISLDTKGCLLLDYLKCDNNQLTHLDVSHNSKLSSLDVSGNPITFLDITKNPMLKTLACLHTGLPVLDVSRNFRLSSLYNDDGTEVKWIRDGRNDSVSRNDVLKLVARLCAGETAVKMRNAVEGLAPSADMDNVIRYLEGFPHGEYADDYGKGFSAAVNMAIQAISHPEDISMEPEPEEER